MRIKSYSIEKLFNTFSYTFSFEERGNVIVVTGPNGYGKTTSLRILHELSRRNYYFFYQLPFDEIRVEFDSDQYLLVTSAKVLRVDQKTKEDFDVWDHKAVHFLWAKKDDTVLSSFQITDTDVTMFQMLSYEQYKNRGKIGEPAPLEEYLLQHPEIYDRVLNKQPNYSKFKVYVEQLSVLYVPSDRIIDKEKGGKSTILEIASALSEKMQEIREKYLLILARSRRQMIDTLLGHPVAMSAVAYNYKREKWLPRVKKLHEWGVIDFNTIKEFRSADDRVLSIYMRELEETLNEFAPIYKRLNLFATKIKEKDFTNKEISVKVQKGFEARLASGEELELTKLSSGEQNEIILLYRLIFDTPKGCLVLIDEPELSLHLSWIRGMLKDYKDIATITDSQYLIATHSAAFISGEWDLTYDLFENDEESADEE